VKKIEGANMAASMSSFLPMKPRGAYLKRFNTRQGMQVIKVQNYQDEGNMIFSKCYFLLIFFIYYIVLFGCFFSSFAFMINISHLAI